MSDYGSNAKVKVVGRDGKEVRGYTTMDQKGGGSTWVRGGKLASPLDLVTGEHRRVTKQIKNVAKKMRGK